uniref:uroporphyrinogen-III synthase n=1 Tax=Pararhizobium sp. IMCC3301 TaxID=3067904 RepID=UPI0027428717|nr:uroporphyrinogen-III synthase [Pararhizobium sp. IMCC3301]
MTRSRADISTHETGLEQGSADSRPYIWVTRPQPQADVHAAALAEHGLRPLLSPVLSIRKLPVPKTPPLVPEAVTGLIFTSLNGVLHFPEPWIAAFARHPVFASGTATLEAAKRAGFTDVHGSTGAGSRGMLDSVRTTIPAEKSAHAPALLYVAGATRTPFLEAALAPNYELTLVETYQAELAAQLTPLAIEAFAANQVAAVTLFSSRSAGHAAKLLQDSFGTRADDVLGSLLAVCISPSVATKARQSGFTRIAISNIETADSMAKKLVEQLKIGAIQTNLL